MQYLPSELISKSLRYNDQSNISRQLSKGLYEASTLDYMESICTDPIKEEEILEYMKYQITFGFVLPGTYNETSMIIMTHSSGFSKYESYVFINIKIGNHNIYIKDLMGMFDSATFYPKDIKIYDLITTYRIMKKRLSCVSINPRFARIYVISLLNDLINVWNNLEDIIYLYSYLYINMRIMNLPIDGPTPKLFLRDTDKKIILQTINDQYGPFIPQMIEDINIYLDMFMI